MMTLDAAFAALLYGPADDSLIEAQGRWHSRGELAQVANGLAAAIDGAGIDAGIAIGLVARNRAAQIAIVAGRLAARAPLVMLHAYQPPDALAAEIEGLGLAVVAADPEDWTEPVRAAALRAGTLGLAVGGSRAEIAVVVPGEARRDCHAPPAETAIEVLTSGTTGAPKRVPIAWSTLEAAIADAQVATAQAGTAAAGRSAPFIQFFPLGNISGLYGLVLALSQGQRIVALEKFSLEAWLRAVRTYRPTTFVSLPPAAIRMVMDAEVSIEDLSSIPALRCGSAPLDPVLQGAFEARYGIPILINYGATEFCGVLANWTLADHRSFAETKRGRVGRARPGIGLRVVNPENGAALPPGEPGRLEVHAERVADRWIATTDLAAIDSEGFVWLHGRADDVIIRGGFKIAPETVAAVLREHAAVAEAAVVGIPDARLGEVPCAAVELRAGAEPPEESELLALLRQRLPAPQVPVAIAVLETLPRNASLKVDRGALRRHFAANQI